MIEIGLYEAGIMSEMAQSIDQLTDKLRSAQFRADVYAADWRKVCAALNTSPDSSVDVVLAKIATLQQAFHAKQH